MDSNQSIDRFNAAVQAYVDMFGQVPWGIDMPEPEGSGVPKPLP